MLLQYFTAKLWGYVRLHRSSDSFSSCSVVQQCHRISISISCLWNSTDQTLLPLGVQHTSLSTAASTAMDRKMRQDQPGPEVQVGPLPPTAASWRWGSPAQICSYGCTWFIYQFHLRHSFQGNWGKDLLQEGLFLPPAVEGCWDVMPALSHSVTGKECLEPGILQAARMRKLPKCFKIKQQTKEMQMNPTESRKQCSIFWYPFVLSGISRAFHQLCPKLRVQITGRGKCAIYKATKTILRVKGIIMD